jgi:hypothetical protein
MTPRLLRNGMIILFLLTAVNVYQTASVLHAINEARAKHAQIENEQRKANAVINQLCLTTHSPCLYTLPMDDGSTGN